MLNPINNIYLQHREIQHTGLRIEQLLHVGLLLNYLNLTSNLTSLETPLLPVLTAQRLEEEGLLLSMLSPLCVS